MSALHALTCVLLAAVPVGVSGAPVPTGPALAQAEAAVQEVFGRDLAAAHKPADRAALARRMIDTAAGSKPAERYALLVRARDMAAAARDSAVGVQAVEGLAGFAGPADASEGHRLWAAARDLAGKLSAAEVYLRALPGIDEKGFERAAVEKRLRELRWPADPELAQLRADLVGRIWHVYWGDKREAPKSCLLAPDGTVTVQGGVKNWNPGQWSVETRPVVRIGANIFILLPSGELRGCFPGTGQSVGAFTEKTSGR